MWTAYGFYNSKNGDRVYNAEQFSSFLDGIVYDGVYRAVGNCFKVEWVSGMKITVDAGRAWFDHTWTLNNAKLGLTVSAADTVYARYDAVVLEVNKNQRANYIKIVKGTPASSPVKPTLTKTANVIQHALAYIKVGKNVTALSQSVIENVVDTSETPIASALALAGIPSGGKIGQVLAKKSGESAAVDWYDLDKLPYNKWYLADGITEANVIAAYKFAHAANETNALISVSEKNSYRLTKSNATTVTWNNSNGFYIPGNESLDNSTIRNANPISIVMRIGAVASGKAICLSGGQSGDYINRYLYASTPYLVNKYTPKNTGYAGYQYATGTAQGDNPGTDQGVRTSTATVGNSVVGITFTGTTGATIYKNGQTLSVALPDKNNITGAMNTKGSRWGRLIGKAAAGSSDAWNNPDRYTWGNFYVLYAAFYSSTLSAAQHKKIYEQITSDLAS